MKKVGIIGGSGYTGGELIRLVVNHPKLVLDFVFSTTRPGTPLYDTHVDLLGRSELSFTDNINLEVDVVFLCVGHGNSVEFLNKNQFSTQTIIIDLSNDFRLEKDAQFQEYDFVYGLPEYFVITGSDLISILFLNVCMYFNLFLESTVSISNIVEKIFVNLDPYPFLPPVIFFSFLS